MNSTTLYRSARASLDFNNGKDSNGPVYLNAPVYQENKQFFYNLVYAPMSGDSSLRAVNKDIINESVYGTKWRERLNSSALTETKARM